MNLENISAQMRFLNLKKHILLVLNSLISSLYKKFYLDLEIFSHPAVSSVRIMTLYEDDFARNGISVSSCLDFNSYN